MLTLDYLRSIGACLEACEWFAATFPTGAEISDALAACQRDDWVCWLACKTSSSYRWWCAGKAFLWAARRNPSLEPWANNVTANNWREAKQAAADADADADADAAAYAAADYADADAARKSAYSELRAEAERVLLAEFAAAGGEARK